MKVFVYKGYAVVVMLRDEHCPPHVHVDGGRWSARFRFSFWHNGVELWDVVRQGRRPALAILEGLRQALKPRVHLARRIWWSKLRTLCLEQQLWDWQANSVVERSSAGRRVYLIESAHYEEQRNLTRLTLVGAAQGVEIEL
ncbi:DUF4160 domain-containing protein [Pseudomonas sp. TKO26]|uniref:DUF4160 domain-containing protein n=1 Tax=unclassified Pseudomonas TaxID=196821 RepID=UPI000D85CB66|nr:MULTISPECIES: DUF4160 domain-containing protein [unclassified Pseudomonas]PYY78383.1 DUF4160 domain-containing protein [Pseudomonas sp. TKO30]PYY79055.1 DUF4160 domain-containing protein [Pseudomonas sp. TKO29]PYY81058.1 DUF4160 domain-containing protein [Pseudomonas sp. TKO26]PYY96057.1 DUF4160 domain-containing protein [Pseudomonas sp. TKO14]